MRADSARRIFAGVRAVEARGRLIRAGAARAPFGTVSVLRCVCSAVPPPVDVSYLRSHTHVPAASTPLRRTHRS